MSTGQSGQKEERTNFTYGHRSRGTIKFGHLWMDEEDGLQTAIQSGVMLQAFDARSYISLDISGARAGWIINRCPGTYQILCGTDLPDDSVGYFLYSEKGDIVIEAPNGSIRMTAQNIDLIAKGADNTRGNINIESNQSVNINTQLFDVKAKTGIRMFTPFTMDIVSNTALRFTSNFIRGLSASSQILPDKNNPLSTASYLVNQLF